MIGYNENAEAKAILAAAEEFFRYLRTEEGDLPSVLLQKLRYDGGFFSFVDGLPATLSYENWQQRPFDLLSHTEGKTKEELFSLLQSWELLSIVQKNREKGIDTIQKSIEYYKDKTLPQRRRLDVYDHQISYEERMARHQGKTLPAHSEIVIPQSLYAAKKTDNWMDVVVFAAMLYRHLKHMGLTAADLEKTDFWFQPGGVRGLSVFIDQQQTAETFFSHLEDAGKMKEPPVRLTSVNDVRMAALSSEVFRAFEDAEEAGRPEPMIHRDGIAIDALGNLHVEDDGTQAPASNIYAYLTNLKNSKDPLDVLVDLFHQKTGSPADLWQTVIKNEDYAAWEPVLLDHLRERSKKMDLLLYRNASKNSRERAAHLLCGYLLYRQDSTFSGTAEDLWAGLTAAIKSDDIGEAYMAYRAFLMAKPHLTILEKTGDTYTLRLKEKISAPDKNNLLEEILTRQTIADWETLHHLFAEAAGQLPKIKDKIKLDLETALVGDKRPIKLLQTFLLLALQWKNSHVKTFTFILSDNPFSCPEDGYGFCCFLNELAAGRVHRALHLENRGTHFIGTVHEVFPKLTDAEAAFLDSLTLEPKENITKEEYYSRIETLDGDLLNGLIRKALPFMEDGLTNEFAEDKLLHRRSKVKEMLGALLLLIILFEMTSEDYRPDFAGQVAISDAYKIDNISAFRDHLLHLIDLRICKIRTKYTVNLTRENGRYMVEIRHKEKAKAREKRSLDR